MECKKSYKICPKYKKSVYQTEKWTNCLSNEKKLILEITTFFRYGEFEIELNDIEKKNIIMKEDIVLNDYDASCDEIWDGCDVYHEVIDIDSFTDEEKKELHNLMYKDNEDPEKYDENCDDMVNLDILENNGWSMDDTIYGISGCFELKEITTDV